MATMYCESLGDFEDNGLIIKTNDKVKILDDSGDGNKYTFHSHNACVCEREL